MATAVAMILWPDPSAGTLRCIDGDSFDLKSNGFEIRYRLAYIDTPEQDQFGYYEATDYTCQALSRGNFVITEHGKDKYGRILASIKISPDPESFGQTTDRPNLPTDDDLSFQLIQNCLAEPFWTKTKPEIIALYRANCQ